MPTFIAHPHYWIPAFAGMTKSTQATAPARIGYSLIFTPSGFNASSTADTMHEIPGIVPPSPAPRARRTPALPL